MRCLAVFLAFLVVPAAWASMEMGDTRDLLARTGFDPDAAEIAHWSQYDNRDAVRRLVREARAASVPDAPQWLITGLPWAERRKLRGDAAAKDRALDRFNLSLLAGEWMQQMVATDTPLRERMVMFWHNHFTSSHRRVKSAAFIYGQHRLFQQQALGNFRELLHAVAKDPAMIVYLDSRSNRKNAPNENFARELLELFTMGEGHYSERDIKEAARAFTGWGLNPQGEFRENPKVHDSGEKTFMGVTGNLDGDQVLDIVLDRPETAEFIVGKLWQEFVSPQLDAAAIKRLAAGFRENYELAPLLEALFMEPAFMQPESRGKLIKSPVELVVGTFRLLETPVGNGLGAAKATSDMGQMLFNPPNVKGWPGAEAWINSDSLLIRYRFLGRALTGRAPSIPKKLAMRLPAVTPEEGEPSRVAQQRVDTVAERLDPATAQRLVLAIAPVESPVEGSTPAERLRAWMLDPAYQMK